MLLELVLHHLHAIVLIELGRLLILEHHRVHVAVRLTPAVVATLSSVELVIARLLVGLVVDHHLRLVLVCLLFLGLVGRRDRTAPLVGQCLLPCPRVLLEDLLVAFNLV